MDLVYLSKEIHRIVKEKGFWDEERNKGEILMLIISELGEALEADRKNRHAVDIDYVIEAMKVPHDEGGQQVFIDAFETHIKDTFDDEIADTIIRILDALEGFYPGYYQESHYHDCLSPGKLASVISCDNLGEALIQITKEISLAYDGFTGNPTYNNLVSGMAMLVGWAIKRNIDIETHINLKMQYNRTRDKLHGKKY